MSVQCYDSESFDRQVGLTNACLYEHEAEYTKARLQAREHQLFRVTEAIKNATDMNRSKLIKDLSTLPYLISRYHISLVPYKNLPLETLQHIFHFVYLGPNFSAPGTHNAPLLLGGVCSEWRLTVLDMPELWRIYISSGSPLTVDLKK